MTIYNLLLSDTGSVTSSSPRPEERLEVSGPPRRDSYAAPCLTCELIKMGSASPYADNSCPQCGKNWSH